MKYSNLTVDKILKLFPTCVRALYNGQLIFGETDDLKTFDQTDLFKDKMVYNFNVNVINCHHYIITMFGE